MLKDDIVRGDNCYLFDKDNNRYVDFEAGIWCTAIGHNNPRINDKIKEQIQRVVHLGPRYTSYLAEEAAASLLHTVSEKDGKCVFLSSGSEAVEFGINIAGLITGRSKMLTLSESYLGAYGCAGMKSANNWIKIDLNDCLNCEEAQCLEDCVNLKEINLDEVGAFVFEPGCSKGMVRFPPEKLIKFIAERVRRCNGLTVVDEVTTGLGRTGRWYGFNHYGIKPDVIAMGKGLGNGYPVSAVAMRNEIAEELERRKFYYVQSHQNDPLGCAIANEVIEIIKEDDLVNRSHKLGNKLISYLNKLKSRFSVIREVRGRGLMIALEFSNPKHDFNVELIAKEMLKRSFIIGYNPDANLIRFLPPLRIEEKEIEALVENLEVVLERQIS
jgi:acetylornithine aminotransferase